MSEFAPLWLLLVAAAGVAGFVDAVAGGGGLIQVPALFAVLPQATPATLFGTNKLASIFGTSNALRRYLRAVPIDWAIALPMAGAAFIVSFLGAATVSALPKEGVRPLAIVLLLAVAAHTALRPEVGRQPAQASVPARQAKPAALIAGAVLGFYDGFFGPGAGSFMIFANVRLFGMDFLCASAAAKIVNAATNAGALLFFAPAGHVLWWLGLAMAAANIAGAQLGSRMAIRHGAPFVRGAFLFMTMALIGKLAWDTFVSD